MGGPAKRVVVFGNSGSGKSTYAKEEASLLNCPHLDLDTVAWLQGVSPPTRKPISDSARAINEFRALSDSWVIEGCYSGLLELAMTECTEIVFLNPGVEVCTLNAKNRPWESHKYSSPEAQNAHLGMLIDWINGYHERTDEFSYSAHRTLFDDFSGPKSEFRSNAR